MVARVRAASDIPVYVGIGVSTPAQAAATARVSDGVIVGSALVQVILDGARRPRCRDLRAIDSVTPIDDARTA